MRDALPFGMLVGFSIIYNKIDVVILAHIRGYAETGLYTSAYKFFDLLAFVPGTISSALYPFFSAQMKAGNLVAVRAYLERYTKLMLGLGLPIAVGGLAVAPRMMLLLGGAQFYGGYPALQIIVFGTAVLFTYGAVNSLMINQLTRYAAAITFINIFINMVGNILLIPHFGFRAAAAMTVASEVFQASCYFYFVQTRIVKFSFWAGTWKAVLAALIMLAVIWPIRNYSLAVTLPLGGIVYALVVLLTGFVSKADIDSVKNLRRAAA
jgi:O-antigen/teichoic acid export membrane protein